jgi:hypothetical protein
MYRFLPVLLCPYRWISTPPQVGHLTASNTIFFLLPELLLILPYSDLVNKYDTLPGNMMLTTLAGSVATTTQNQTKMVNGGFQNLTVVGEPPSTAVLITNDTSLRYVITKQALNLG